MPPNHRCADRPGPWTRGRASIPPPSSAPNPPMKRPGRRVASIPAETKSRTARHTVLPVVPTCLHAPCLLIATESTSAAWAPYPLPGAIPEVTRIVARPGARENRPEAPSVSARVAFVEGRQAAAPSAGAAPWAPIDHTCPTGAPGVIAAGGSCILMPAVPRYTCAVRAATSPNRRTTDEPQDHGTANRSVGRAGGCRIGRPRRMRRYRAVGSGSASRGRYRRVRRPVRLHVRPE